MSSLEPGTAGAGLVERIKSLILRPSESWDAIAVEPATTEGLYRGWVVPLAAIPAVCGAVGLLAFGGIHIFGVAWHPSLVGTVTQMLIRYVLTLAEVFILSLVIDGFAPQFGGERNPIQALKVAAYSGTPSWIAGVFMLLPTLGGLAALIGGLYSLYLVYLGLPKLMKSDPTKSTPYLAVTLIVALLLGLVVGSVTSGLGLGGYHGMVDFN